MNYNEINASLNRKITLVRKKISFLDQLKTSGEVTLTSEEIEKQLSEETVLEKDEIAFILEYKSKSRAKHNEEYQGVLINTLESRGKLLGYVKQNIASRQPFTYDIIMMNIDGYHCTPLRLTFKEKLRVFAIDAAGADSPSLIQFLQALKRIEDSSKEIRVHVGSIQKDYYSCAIFSIQDLNTMSKLGDELDKYLRTWESGMRIGELHPRFVKNSQNMETIATNTNSMLKVSKHKNLEQYVNNYSVGTGEKKRNYAIFYKTLKYLQAAQEEVKQAFNFGGEKAVQEIIQQRTGGIIWGAERNNALNEQVKTIAAKLQKLHTTNRVNYGTVNKEI